MPEEQLNPDHSALEAALASLAPAASRVDRDRLMYLAGQAAATPRRGRPLPHWFWPTCTAASLLLAATFGSFWLRDGLRPAQVAAIPEPIADTASDALASHSGLADYLRLRQLVIEQGVDALPSSGSSSSTGQPQPPLRAGDIEKWLSETRS